MEKKPPACTLLPEHGSTIAIWHMSARGLARVAAVVVGCGGNAATTPGTVDANIQDASTTDARTTDAPTADAQTADATTADAGTTDAISDVDATAAEGGPRDAASTSDTGGPSVCGDAACGAGEICILGRCAGCCNVPPGCIPCRRAARALPRAGASPAIHAAGARHANRWKPMASTAATAGASAPRLGLQSTRRRGHSASPTCARATWSTACIEVSSRSCPLSAWDGGPSPFTQSCA